MAESVACEQRLLPSPGRRIFLRGVQVIESALEFLQFLSRCAEFAFCGQALVVGEVLGGLRDLRIEVRPGLSRCSCGCCASDGGTSVIAFAVSDEGAPPNSDAIADSKVGPYARRSCNASTTRRNSGMGLRSACK